MSIEAMKLALEALIWTTGSGDFGEGGQAREGALKCLFPAITALEQAIEQAEKQEREALFQAQNAAIGLARQLEIYEAALEQIILCREDSLEATKAKQALAQVRGVLL